MPSPSPRQPTLFISHGGGPCFFMDWDPPDTWRSLGDWLRQLPSQLGSRPSAILMVSAHWESPEFSLTGHAQPPLIYDYAGFPPHTYQLTYPAPGAPALAQQTRELLEAAGLGAHIDPARGWDHGVFVPMKLIAPAADIPLVQLSLKAGLDAATHLAAGRALAPLRDQGVLIIGSGYSYHNMRGYGGAGRRDAAAFDQWLSQSLTQPDAASRESALLHWQQAPSARAAHPREEHLLPLMVAAGAAGGDAAERVFSDEVFGVATSCFRFG